MRVSIPLLLASVFTIQSLFAENWPFWRGPSRQGISTETGLPSQWSSDSNVVWKAEIPGESWSSPIVFDEQVFLTTATGDGVNCHVIALDKKNGKVSWNKNVFEQVPLRKERLNSFATPTPATDGERVYAVFGDGSVVALNSRDGSFAWQYREVNFYSQHGLGSSPVLHGDLLIMAYDGSSRGENKRVGWQIPWDESYLLAFDKNTGKVRWKATRGQSRIAHVTPNILKHQGNELLISGAGDVVQAFELSNGDRLWSVYSQGEGVVPSIVLGDGIIFTASGFEKPTIRAIRPPSSAGEEPTIVWEQTRSVPMIPSFVYANGYLFGITEGGIAICLKGSDGELVWQERVGGKHSASPIWAENRIYFLSESAETTVIEATPEFKILARNSLEGQCQASIAVSDGQLFIRTARELYCIGSR